MPPTTADDRRVSTTVEPAQLFTHGRWIDDGHTVTLRICKAAVLFVVGCPADSETAHGSGAVFPCRRVVGDTGEEVAGRVLAGCRLADDPGRVMRFGLLALDVYGYDDAYPVTRAGIPIAWLWLSVPGQFAWKPVDADCDSIEQIYWRWDDPATFALGARSQGGGPS